MRVIRFERGKGDVVHACVGSLLPDGTIVIEDLALDLPTDDLGERVKRYVYEAQKKYGSLVIILPGYGTSPPSTHQPERVERGGMGAGKNTRIAHMIADELLRRRKE